MINNPPIKVTAQRGMDSKNPQSSIAVLILSGKTVGVVPPMPEADIILLISPCVIENRLISSSSPWVTAAFARANRIKSFSACSGFFTSVKLYYRTHEGKKEKKPIMTSFPFLCLGAVVRRLIILLRGKLCLSANPQSDNEYQPFVPVRHCLFDGRGLQYGISVH